MLFDSVVIYSLISHMDLNMDVGRVGFRADPTSHGPKQLGPTFHRVGTDWKVQNRAQAHGMSGRRA